jgi:hypothetical protein
MADSKPGYFVTPLSPMQVARLRNLTGDFRRSTARDIYLWTAIQLTVFASLVAIGLIGWLWYRTGLKSDGVSLLPALLLPLMAGGIAVRAARNMGIVYRFETGMIVCLSFNGRVIWEESLRELKACAFYISVPNSILSLQLEWPDHKKNIELVPALRRALIGQ